MSQITDWDNLQGFFRRHRPDPQHCAVHVKNGKINQENPGVFFYWVKITAPAGNNTVVVNQSITTGNFNTLFAIASGSNVYNSSCKNVHGTFTQSQEIPER